MEEFLSTYNFYLDCLKSHSEDKLDLFYKAALLAAEENKMLLFRSNKYLPKKVLSEEEMSV